MHENGVGVRQDFHLAKRFYDQALVTNRDSYLPVNLALLKLRVRSAYNTLTRGDVNSIGTDSDTGETPRSFFAQLRMVFREWFDDAARDAALARQEPEAVDEMALFYDEYEQTWANADDDSMGGTVELGELIMIMGLCAAIAFLMWLRTNRRQYHEARMRELQTVSSSTAPSAKASTVTDSEAPHPDDRPGPPAHEARRDLFPDQNQPNNPELARWLGGAAIN